MASSVPSVKVVSSPKGIETLTEPDDQEVEALKKAQDRYLAAMHVAQAGVGAKMQFDPSDTTPKFLRAGINSSLIQQGALVKILIDKGIITEVEWVTALADIAEEEVKLYERILSDITGATVTLQ